MRFIVDPILKNVPWQSEYNFHFIAKPTMGSHLEMMSVIQWCIEQFGPIDQGRWHAQGWRVDFLTQVDAAAFRIRWG